MNPDLKSLFVIIAVIAALVIVGILISREGGLTGAAVRTAVACYDDADCNDRIAETEDICRNPGTAYSLCVNRRNE